MRSLDGIIKSQRDTPLEGDNNVVPVSDDKNNAVNTLISGSQNDFWPAEFPKPQKPRRSFNFKFTFPKIKFAKPSLKLNFSFLPRKAVLTTLIVILILWGGAQVFSALPFNSIEENLSLLKLFKPGQYLVLFQNNAELRPTGGFMGSFADIDLGLGKISNVDFETNIYKRDKMFGYKVKLEPPEPIREFNKEDLWHMRDSNWSVDFPEAAQTIAWFYNQEGGREVDGVFAIDTTFITDILRLVGPIEMPEYNTTITADNFLSVVQYKVEIEYFQNPDNVEKNEPKSILKDMYPRILEKIKKADKKILGQIVLDNLKSKHILLYFRDGDSEKQVLEKNWGGGVVKTGGDYLAVNSANLTFSDKFAGLGAKSSLNISENIELNTEMTGDGEVINNLEVTRTHKGDGVWPDGNNDSFVRVFVPDGAALLDAQLGNKSVLNQIRLSREAGKTVFGAWVRLKPGDSKTLTLSYKLPFKLQKLDDYSLLVQKQPGTLPSGLNISLNGQQKFNGLLDGDTDIK